MNKNKISLAGFLLSFFGAVLFSTKAIIVKKAFAGTGVDALTLLTIRMIFSLPFFVAAAFLINNQAGNVRLKKAQWVAIIFLGFCGYYLSSYFDFVGLQYISAGLERLILFLYPTFVVLINLFAFRQKITRVQLAALVLTYSGIAIAYFNEMRLDTENENFVRGSIFIFICAITYAVYIVGSGRIIPIIGPNKFTAYAMLAATAGIFIHFMVQGNYQVLVNSGDLWSYGLLLGIMATVIPSFMVSAGMARIGSNNLAIISSIGPVSTILQAHWILGERILGGQIVGTILVIAGVLLTAWKRNSGSSAA